MSVNYSPAAIDARLQAVVTTIGIGGNLKLYAGATLISTIPLSNPAGTVSGGVLTFTGTLIDTAASATGNVDSGVIEDSLGNAVIFGLTVGVPPSTGYDILVVNGLNTTLITIGQVVSVTAAQITGS